MSSAQLTADHVLKIYDRSTACQPKQLFNFLGSILASHKSEFKTKKNPYLMQENAIQPSYFRVHLMMEVILTGKNGNSTWGGDSVLTTLPGWTVLTYLRLGEGGCVELKSVVYP